MICVIDKAAIFCKELDEQETMDGDVDSTLAPDTTVEERIEKLELAFAMTTLKTARPERSVERQPSATLSRPSALSLSPASNQ